MIEVDVPSLPLRECHQVAYDWALATLPQGVRGSSMLHPAADQRRSIVAGAPA
jgi:hypothetical protein